MARADRSLAGLVPSLQGPGLAAVTAHMRRVHEEQGPKPTADGTRLRGSMARNCARKIAFEIIGEPAEIPFEDSTLVAFEVGNLWHETIQLALAEQYDAKTEVMVSYREVGFDLSGSADAVYRWGNATVCVEIKSMKTFAWDLQTKGNYTMGQPSGPKPEHLVQAGLYAMSPQIQAHIVHMIYVNKDDGRLTEWLIPLEEDLGPMGLPERSISSLVKTEIRRMQDILMDIDSGVLPARDIPGYGLVEEPPPRGSKGQPWNCRFCPYQPKCSTLFVDAVPGYSKE